MDENFDAAFDLLCKLEGYSSNVAGDPGGRTIWGVAERYFPAEVAAMSAMPADAARAYAKGFYRKTFWDRCKCGTMGSPMDMAVFICAVNPGTGFIEGVKGVTDWKDLCLATVDYYRMRALTQKPCCYSGNCIEERTRCPRRFTVGLVGRVIELWRTLRRRVAS